MKRKQRESPWTVKVMKEMAERGCVTVTLSAGLRQQNGVPDRWVCGPASYGFACWLEFKGETTRVQLDQQLLLRRIRERQPYAAFVVRYPGTVEDEAGNVFATFDGTGADLMEALKLLCRL